MNFLTRLFGKKEPELPAGYLELINTLIDLDNALFSENRYTDTNKKSISLKEYINNKKQEK